jgi:hypothetical protein
MFEPNFYQTVLPDRVRQECAQRPSHVPVVEFRLADGITLDVCHIVHLADKWLAVAYFRDSSACQDMDIAFLGYEMVLRVMLSLHDPRARRLGFTLGQPAGAPAGAGEEARV